MKVVFFKRPTPRQFDYKPRYYDEKKEREEKRRKALEDAQSGDTTFLRDEINRRWRKADTKNRNRAKGINLLIFILVAAGLIYFMFFM